MGPTELAGISAAAAIAIALVIIALALLRVVRERRRGAALRHALRTGLGPIAASGAAQSSAFGWTPSASSEPSAVAGPDDRGDRQ